MARATRELVNAVNPRLALYTHAGMLALTILVLNYAVVVGLAFLLMTRCSSITQVERTYPVTSGDFVSYEAFINQTLDREKITKSDGVTVTTTVRGCAKRSTSTIVAPHPKGYRYYDPSANASSYAPYGGTGVAVEVPCWNPYLPCLTGGYEDFSYDQPSSETNLQCDWYHFPWAQALPEVSSEMPAKADRFPWCSAEEEASSRSHFARMQNLSSQVFGGTVDLSVYCGDNIDVFPGGVTTPSLSNVPAVGNQGTLTPFTTYWELDATTTTEICPTFAIAFGSAFGYAAQIEILITMVLIFVFKKASIIQNAEDWVDIGTDGMMKKDAFAELVAASTTTADALANAENGLPPSPVSQHAPQNV